MLKDKIKKDLIKALKEKDGLRVSVFRMFLSAVSNKEIELEKKEEGLSEEEIEQVLKKQIKNRKKSIEAFKNGGREDLAEKEGKEKEILEEYLSAGGQDAKEGE